MISHIPRPDNDDIFNFFNQKTTLKLQQAVLKTVSGFYITTPTREPVGSEIETFLEPTGLPVEVI
jgi:hypothetical protein